MLVIEIKPHPRSTAKGLIPAVEWDMNDNQPKQDFTEEVERLIERHDGEIIRMFATGAELNAINDFIATEIKDSSIPRLIAAKGCTWTGDHAKFLYYNFFN